ncbi:MAG: glutaredoxin family protein [Ornithinimicrobium sp.]
MAAREHDAGAPVAAVLPSVDDKGRPVRITLLTRPGCHLCEVAIEAVEATVADLSPPVGYACVDIDQFADPARANLLARYGEWLPVTFVDGSQHDYWRIDPDRLAAALSRR